MKKKRNYRTRDSVIRSFMLDKPETRQCVLCGCVINTMGEDFYFDRVCTACGSNMLEFLRRHRHDTP